MNTAPLNDLLQRGRHRAYLHAHDVVRNHRADHLRECVADWEAGRVADQPRTGALHEQMLDFAWSVAEEMIDAGAAWLIVEHLGVAEGRSYDGPVRWFTLRVADEVMDAVSASLACEEVVAA